MINLIILTGLGLLLVITIFAISKPRHSEPSLSALSKDSQEFAPPSGGSKSAPSISPKVQQLIKDDRKLEAIKIYRDEAGVGLRDAKQIIERHIDEAGQHKIDPAKKSAGSYLTCRKCGHMQPIKSFRLYFSCPICKETYGD